MSALASFSLELGKSRNIGGRGGGRGGPAGSAACHLTSSVSDKYTSG